MQTGNRAQKRGLAHPVAAEQSDRLTRADFDPDAGKYGAYPIGGADLFKCKQFRTPRRGQDIRT